MRPEEGVRVWRVRCGCVGDAPGPVGRHSGCVGAVFGHSVADNVSGSVNLTDRDSQHEHDVFTCKI